MTTELNMKPGRIFTCTEKNSKRPTTRKWLCIKKTEDGKLLGVYDKGWGDLTTKKMITVVPKELDRVETLPFYVNPNARQLITFNDLHDPEYYGVMAGTGFESRRKVMLSEDEMYKTIDLFNLQNLNQHMLVPPGRVLYIENKDEDKEHPEYHCIFSLLPCKEKYQITGFISKWKGHDHSVPKHICKNYNWLKYLLENNLRLDQIIDMPRLLAKPYYELLEYQQDPDKAMSIERIISIPSNGFIQSVKIVMK